MTEQRPMQGAFFFVQAWRTVVDGEDGEEKAKGVVILRTKLIFLCLLTLLISGLYGAIEIVHARQKEHFNLAQYPDVQKLLEERIEQKPVRRKLSGLIEKALQKKCEAEYGTGCPEQEVTSTEKTMSIRAALLFATSKFTGAELGHLADLYMNRKQLSQTEISQVEADISERFSVADMEALRDALESGE